MSGPVEAPRRLRDGCFTGLFTRVVEEDNNPASRLRRTLSRFDPLDPAVRRVADQDPAISGLVDYHKKLKKGMLTPSQGCTSDL